MTRHASFPLCRLASCLLVAFAGSAQAAPAGGVVAAGAASISSSGRTTTITQSSQNASINWQSFGIAGGETVQFRQPGSNSVALNRVLGPDPSAIFGNLSANGRVFLVNPNGILFGSGASVNVGALVASTLSISDTDFMAGRYSFSGASRASVLNNGDIRADGGYVALLGAQVANDGSIGANRGSVALAAGQAMTLDMAGDKLLNVTVDRGAVDALVRNGGLVRSDGGQVLMTTQAAGNLLSTVVNNTGIVQARSIGIDKGTIRLLGDMQSGTVSTSGTLDVSGDGAGQSGGTVVATAHHVGVFGGSIDASGSQGGGTVLVGGGYQGGNASVANASATYMSADASINADAKAAGNAGQVVLWAKDSTRAYGSITARGGAQGGNGGMVETSAHSLDVNGLSVNAGSANGQRGTWLLDPADVTIGAGTTNGAFVANVFTPNSGASAATVDVAALRMALEAGGGTDVTVTTTNAGAPGGGQGNITVAAPLTWTPTNATTLTLKAAGDVNINAAVTATKGNLVVCCGRDVNVRSAITTTNGSTLLSAGRDANIIRDGANTTAGITATDGNVKICAANDINLKNGFNLAPLITVTNGSAVGGQSLANLGVPGGLTLNAGTGGTGPGAAGGTVKFVGGTFATMTNAAVNINYNPVSYLAPSNYSGNFTPGTVINQRMLVFAAGGDKPFDGGTATVLTGLKGAPANVTLQNNPGSVANFDTPAVGVGKSVTYSGYTLVGLDAAKFALAENCCGPVLAHTTAAITPLAPVVVPPIAAPGVIVPVPVPAVIGTPPVVVVSVDSAASPVALASDSASNRLLPQFAPFVVAPALLSTRGALLVASPPVAPPVSLVVSREEPAPLVSPGGAAPDAAAPAAPAPAVAPAVARPLPAPPVRMPKPFRN